MSDTSPCTPTDFWADDVAAGQRRATGAPAIIAFAEQHDIPLLPWQKRTLMRLFPDIWTEVHAERERAHAKHGNKSMESAPWTAERRLRILLEEVGEVAKELNDAEVEERSVDAGRLRRELIQVAAMAGAWADACPPDEPTSKEGWNLNEYAIRREVTPWDRHVAGDA
ncbi:hypothetical protein [Terrabacter terrigena]|uniref:Uncharacterized protein n=1 Tax=Terrabacter terrigena TaxID=574718 RepID=A0ABW3N0V3_9MICO